MNLHLIRKESGGDGVFGVLRVGTIALHTVEDDWKNNEPGESCIPDGTYKLVRTQYHHGGYETFWVTNVEGRQRILIHRANTEEDVKGCIGVGMRRGFLWVHDEDNPDHPLVKKNAVVESREAHTAFMQAMQGVDEATLVIQWRDGLP